MRYRQIIVSTGFIALLLSAYALIGCASTAITASSMTIPASFGSRAPRRPVATYSIVARDGKTGQLGVAVQSHWFGVGSSVPWAMAGVGAVATQSFVEVSYGPLGLELMEGGKSATEALDALTSIDPNASVRQVAMVDAHGNVAAHTGAMCIAHAGHTTGKLEDGTVYSVQSNLMAPSTVPAAMSQAFESATGKLAERLMVALEAAQAEGGDIRGRQSAAILVVAAHPTGSPATDRIVDLRIEDHPTPIVEMRRLLTLHSAYEYMNAGDLAIEHNDTDAALGAYGAALKLAPNIAEMSFWTGVSLASVGMVDEALPHLATAFADKQGDWKEVLRRLPASNLLPDDPALLVRLLAAGAPASTNQP
jgi:uncharacterized Ntn-hydrolase superfamily protein